MACQEITSLPNRLRRFCGVYPWAFARSGVVIEVILGAAGVSRGSIPPSPRSPKSLHGHHFLLDPVLQAPNAHHRIINIAGCRIFAAMNRNEADLSGNKFVRTRRSPAEYGSGGTGSCAYGGFRSRAARIGRRLVSVESQTYTRERQLRDIYKDQRGALSSLGFHCYDSIRVKFPLILLLSGFAVVPITDLSWERHPNE